MDDLVYRLALMRAPGVGPVTYRDLVARFGSARAVFDPVAAEELRDTGLAAYLKRPEWDAAERDLAWANDTDRFVIVPEDACYPAAVRALADRPPVLFVRGAADVLDAPQLAIVGSRNPSAAGVDTATDFARYMAGLGLVVTSGLALGIDGAAHRGALAGGGRTVAVVGTGPDRIYPARHRALAHAIIDSGGAIVGEMPPGTPPSAANFPRRNRIISGLSLGVLVVEAALRSGSLITARQAAEQGREVFAIPGSIHNPLAKGCHRLIRDGAKLVESGEDILVELEPKLRPLLDTPPGRPNLPEPSGGDGVTALEGDYKLLLESVGFEPVSVDILVERTQLTAEAVSSMLLILELEGHIVPAPGKRYTRVSKRA